MSVTHGADVEGLRAGARELADVAHELLAVSVRLTARVWDVRWNGPDAARFRVAWEEEHAPALGRVCTALHQTASELAAQAADQERASSSDGATTSATDDLQARLSEVRDALMQLPTLTRMVQTLAAHPEALTDAATFTRAWQLSETFGSTFEKVGGEVLGGVGTVLTAKALYEAYQAGDLTGLVQNVVSLGAPGPYGVAWDFGSAVGNQLNEAMEGTEYGDRVRDNFDFVFEQFGPAGMLLTPAVLIQSGIEMVVDDDAPPIP